MEKVIVSKNSLKAIEEELNSVVSRSDAKKYKGIFDSAKIEFTGDRVTNITLWLRHIVSTMDELSERDPFRAGLKDRNQWIIRGTDISIIREFIRYSKKWETYEFLSGESWRDLVSVLDIVPEKNGLPRMPLKEYINRGGHVFDFYKPFLIDNADPAAVKFTETLKAFLDKNLKNLNPAEQQNIPFAISLYLDSQQGNAVSFEELHNTIFKTV